MIFIYNNSKQILFGREGVILLFTISALGEMIKEVYPSAVVKQKHSNSLKGVRLYKPNNMALYSDYLNLCKNSDLNDNTCYEYDYLIVGEPAANLNINNYICIPENLDELFLLDIVNGIFHKYLYWEISLLNSVANSSGIQQMINDSVNIFENPINVFDMSLRLLGMDKSLLNYFEFDNTFELNNTFNFDNTIEYYISIAGQNYMSDDIVKLSNINGFFNLLKNHKGAFLFKEFGMTIIVCGIRSNNNYLGFLTIPVIKKEVSNLQLRLSEILANYISQEIEKEISISETPYLSNVLTLNLVTDRTQNKSALQYQLSRLGWKIHDNYSIMVMKTLNRNEEFNKIVQYLRYDLIRIFPDSQIMTCNDTIVFITHEQTFLCSSDEKKEKFRSILMSKDIICGCSMDFDYFLEAPDCYEQALTALNYYSSNSRYNPITLYQDCMPNHVIKKFKLDYDARRFIHPAIRTLSNYDLRHESNLVETLYVYLLYDKSYKTCTEKLFIQKSTLKYRLEKIKKISGDECFEPKSRVSILLSIKMFLIQKYDAPDLTSSGSLKK